MTTVTSSAPPVTSESRAVPGVARYTAGYLPTSFGTWPQVGRKLLRIMLVSLGIAVLVNPEAWSSLRYFSINYAFTFAYTAGLWLTNGLSVDWLNARVPWTRQPGRRLAPKSAGRRKKPRPPTGEAGLTGPGARALVCQT